MTTTREELGSKSDYATLRSVVKADLKALANLDEEVFGNAAYSLMYMTSLYLMFRKSWYLAEHEGGLAGYALVCPDSDNSEVWLMGLAVSGNCQGHGLGRTLMARAMELMMDSGAPDAYITVRPDNKAARHLYEAFEFTADGEERDNFYGNGEPRQVFHRSLVKNPYTAAPA
ncbi:GNAT family N-acetyltransferase [Catenulispora sp. NF23]|uniref:GNAT family N-acetyltransferase n=1 Tax=Catenulispora pinistramenti TaxID=2705254 RepID=A0ABS5KNS9_9ACTN|nr:GNAT family N-acetyltransferase [Catenulispora pinistramenti]MBS2531795.1 GNAT family N-acetyltransferase [Catenulispora pinistramenti]MBS2547659.1 GNAT family N-acetyltransferase [Catenulispora pinistramenti]